MACFGLVTFFFERPLRNVPAFISSMAFWTFLPLALLYLAAITFPFSLEERCDLHRTERAAQIWRELPVKDVIDCECHLTTKAGAGR
jgi:hypothetical protein